MLFRSSDKRVLIYRNVRGRSLQRGYLHVSYTFRSECKRACNDAGILAASPAPCKNFPKLVYSFRCKKSCIVNLQRRLHYETRLSCDSLKLSALCSDSGRRHSDRWSAFTGAEWNHASLVRKKPNSAGRRSDCRRARAALERRTVGFTVSAELPGCVRYETRYLLRVSRRGLATRFGSYRVSTFPVGSDNSNDNRRLTAAGGCVSPLHETRMRSSCENMNRVR